MCVNASLRIPLNSFIILTGAQSLTYAVHRHRKPRRD
jgi:hypothetical protein